MTNPPRRFLLVTIGSHGDVHPFVGLAAALKSRGHIVTLMASGKFASLAEREGIEFLPIGTAEEYDKLTHNRDLFHKTRGGRAVFMSVLEILRPVYELIAKYVEAHGDVTVAASSLGLSARIAQEKFRFPLATVHLAPSILRSSIKPPKLPGLYMPGWMPMWMRRGTWRIVDAVVDSWIAREVNAYRAQLGIQPRTTRLLKDWWLSPDLVIGLFPEWFARDPGDWPKQTKLTGFPLYDERGHAPLSPALESFLDKFAGRAPIAFTPGSAMRFGESFFKTAVDACARINRRAILLTRHPEGQVPASLPDHAIHVDYAPFSELLPRCSALVHHGGIGTTSQALRAGTPQLIMPMSHDQFDNAARVKALDAGDEIDQKKFKPIFVAEKLQKLVDHSTTAAACANIASRFFRVDGLALTCDALEELSNRRANSGGL